MEYKGFQFATTGCLSMLYYSLRLAICTVSVSPDSARECQNIYDGSVNSVVKYFGLSVHWTIDAGMYACTIFMNMVSTARTPFGRAFDGRIPRRGRSAPRRRGGAADDPR